MTMPCACEYRPYDQLPEFRVGYESFQRGFYTCPYDSNSVAAQAWDRGLEFASRVERFLRENAK